MYLYVAEKIVMSPIMTIEMTVISFRPWEV